MLKVCNIDIQHLQEVYKRLDLFIKKLKESFPIQEIYLFGSFAENKIHEGSDIDLIIIGDIPGRIFDRIDKVLRLTDLPIEPMIYSPSEFNRMKLQKNPFILSALRTAKKLS